MRKVLVTGASGFIGGAAAARLAAEGYMVRAVYRRQTPPDILRQVRAWGGEVTRLDLIDPATAATAVQGMEAVVHVAALASDWGSEELFRRINTELTLRLLGEAQRAGCRAFVYLSSVAVHGFGRHVHTTEQGPYYRLINPYQRSKKAAEQGVLLANTPALRTVVIRAGNVYGPRDTTTFYRIFAAMQQGMMGLLGGGRSLTCTVFVDDLVEAILLGLEKEAGAGEIFNITGGEVVSWRELLEHSANLLGLPPLKKDYPFALAYALAYLLTGIGRLLGKRSAPPLTVYRVAQLAHDYHFSIEKARRILGYNPRVGWREGLERTVKAYLEEQRNNGTEGY